MKQSIIVSLAIGAVLGTGYLLLPKLFGADLTTESTFLQTIDTQQATELFDGKYKHIPLTDTKIDGKDVKYEVTEYQTPKGEVGYQTIIYYPDRVVSINVGVETHRNSEYFYPPCVASSSPCEK